MSISEPASNDERRFWGSVAVGGSDDCWPWQKSVNSGGYGVFHTGGRKQPAHRAAWQFHNGERIPADLFGLHRCDNPPCCNPAHIFVGTQQDNMDDMAAKGRSKRATCKFGHTLTRPAGKEAYCHTCKRARGREFDRKRRRAAGAKPGFRPERDALDAEAVRTIRASTQSHAELGRRFGVRPETIAKARKGETWGHVL